MRRSNSRQKKVVCGKPSGRKHERESGDNHKKWKYHDLFFTLAASQLIYLLQLLHADKFDCKIIGSITNMPKWI